MIVFAEAITEAITEIVIAEGVKFIITLLSFTLIILLSSSSSALSRIRILKSNDINAFHVYF